MEGFHMGAHKRRVSVGDFKIGKNERKAIDEVLDSGRLSEGKKVREFENRFAEYVGTDYCVALSSGTAALIAGLTALIYDPRFPKIKKGSKIITSPVTYVSTSNAIVLAGLEPVYVDISAQDFTLIPAQIEEILQKGNPDEFGAILPVHLMGYPNDMDSINAIAAKYDLVTFEDSAQAHGSIYKGKKTGSLSLLSDFSFYIAHNIQAGEMGAITTNDRKLGGLIRRIKSNGRLCDCLVCRRSEGLCPRARMSGVDDDEDVDPRFTHDLIAYNFKLMDFQAALAITQLEKADEIFLKRQKNIQYLNTHLAEFADKLALPMFSPDVSYLAYPMVLKEKTVSRKNLRRQLEDMGIETRPLFGCIPTQQPAYEHLKEQYQGTLPNADYVGRNGFYIGCHQYLDEEDLQYVVEGFKKLFLA